MLALFRFLAGPAGRLTRIAAGLLLIVAGVWWIAGIAGWVVVVVGLVPLTAGIFDWCVFAPLFGLPLLGSYLRPNLERERHA
jgi:hypothetical protein